MSTMGKLYVLEGPDGVGKTTIAKGVVEHLNAKGITTHYFSFPGNETGTLGKHVYDMHHGLGKANISNTSLQVLHVAAHIDVLEQRILPILRTGENIVLDRFWWSTWVYGRVAQIGENILNKLIETELLVWDGVCPEAIFLLSRPNPMLVEETDQWDLLGKEYEALGASSKAASPVFYIVNDLTVEAAVEKVTGHLGLPGEDGSTDCATSHRGDIFSKLSPVKTTVVYDTYWRFATERQAIFFSRFYRKPLPWTNDQILFRHKFTNAYRASDRVSQYLIRDVIYSDDYSVEDLFVRILLFKLFNKIETWTLLEERLGVITAESYSESAIDEILSAELEHGTRIYSAAYIMPSGSKGFRFPKKHKMHLHLLRMMIEDGMPRSLAESKSMKNGFDLFRAYPTIGDFLAYQFITDINYSPITDFSETEFVVPGPGALNGIKKCFLDTGGLNECDIIQWVMERQEAEFDRLGLDFQSLWGRPLQLIDCQNLFCETDKYSRVKHPEFSEMTGRTRIKQKYHQTPKPISFFYPPKWGINEKIQELP